MLCPKLSRTDTRLHRAGLDLPIVHSALTQYTVIIVDGVANTVNIGVILVTIIIIQVRRGAIDSSSLLLNYIVTIMIIISLYTSGIPGSGGP